MDADKDRAFSILGVSAGKTLTPRDAADCVEVFSAARSCGHSVACLGAGTELELGAPPTRLDVLVGTTSLARVLDYTPEDQVIDVEAGLSLGALQTLLAARGQRLACDPPGASAATLGGLLATNAFGPLRTRYGSLRDLIIGVTLLRADGVVAHGGGKVVKTVAGFDLPKLAVGSLGTLGMILGATFRVHPLPENSSTLWLDGLTAAAVRTLVVDMRDAQLEPTAIAAVSGGAGYALGVRFEGFADGVAQQCDRLRERASSSDLHCASLDVAEAARFWSEHDRARLAGDVRVKLCALPSELATRLPEVTARLGAAVSDATIVWYPSLGLAFATGHVIDAARFATWLADARQQLARTRGFAVVERAPLSVRASIGDVWGPRPAAHGLMRLLKSRFDPEGRMNPGRLLEGA